jgi:hypothetical protein
MSIPPSSLFLHLLSFRIKIITPFILYNVATSRERRASGPSGGTGGERYSSDGNTKPLLPGFSSKLRPIKEVGTGRIRKREKGLRFELGGCRKPFVVMVLRVGVGPARWRTTEGF